jgi:asparagine synthase (glutamine-hydrolysing)
MTMAHSLEARVPFLDHELVELAMRTPSAWKVRGGVGKSILKDAMRGRIPDSVIDRPKMGFGAPMAEWLRGDFGHEVERSVLGSELFKSGWFRPTVVRRLFEGHRSGARNYAHYLWVLYNLVAWHEHWIASPQQP